MATMDIFESDAFSVIELTRALENIPFKPALLSSANLFSPRGVRSRTVVIESRDGTLSLIPFSERGSAYEQQVPERRDMRAFVCRQFKKQDVLWASEIQSVRDFGSETATQQVQTAAAHRLRRLRQDAEATFEYHFLNGIQGIVKDPKDGATVIDYAAEFGITPAAEIDFDLDNASPASGALRKRCQALIESVEESLGGLAAGAVQVRAECGSAFFADLVAHKEVRETYLNTAAALDVLFADAHLSREVVYTADGGIAALVRAILRRPDEVAEFGDARLWSETTRLDLRLSEVPTPRPGDRIEIDGEAFLIQGEPVRDRERLTWTVDLRPA